MARFRPLRSKDVAVLSENMSSFPVMWGDVYVLTGWIEGPFRDARRPGEQVRYWWDPDGVCGIEGTFRLAVQVLVLPEVGAWEWRVYRNGTVCSGECADVEEAKRCADAMHKTMWLFPRVRSRQTRETEDHSVMVPVRVFGELRLLPWLWFSTPRRCYDRYVRVWARTPTLPSRELVERAYPGNAWQGTEVRQLEPGGDWIWRVRVDEDKVQGVVSSLDLAFKAVDVSLDGMLAVSDSLVA